MKRLEWPWKLGGILAVLTLTAGAVVLGLQKDVVKTKPNRLNAVSQIVSAEKATQTVPQRLTSIPAAVKESEPTETKTVRFDGLARGTPAEALEAVNLLQECLKAESFTRMIAESQIDPKLLGAIEAMSPKKNSCDGLTGGQKSQLVPLALKAAEAHVAGAFAQVLRLATSDDWRADPRIEQAWGNILEANLKAADPDALVARFGYEMNCETQNCDNTDPRAALVHWTTLKYARPLRRPDTVTPLLTEKLGPEQAAAAIAEGKAAYERRTAWRLQ